MNKRIGALVLAVIMVLLLVAAPLSSIANAAEGTFSLAFHYDRPDGNYSNWDLFGWTSNGSAGYPFAADTDGEDVAATVELPAGTESFGFIVRNGGDSWTAKDPDGDRTVESVYADLYKVIGGTIHVYLTSGQSAFTVEAGDDVVLDDGAETPAPVEANYFVAGVEALCGSNWSCDDPANKMTLKSSGLYEIVYKNVPAGTYEFKVTDGTWNNSWGGEWGNYSITLTEEQNVVISFNADTKLITVTLLNPELPFYVAGTGDLCGAEWDPGFAANKMSRNDEGLYEIFYQSVPAGHHEFKVTDGTWNNSWGKDGGSANVAFDTTTECNVTITFNADTHQITVTTVEVLLFTVAGTEELCGQGWAPAFMENKMALGADGLYTKTFKSVPAGHHEFKVTDGSWNNSWGKDGGSANYVFETEEVRDVTITFNAQTKEITVTFSAATAPDPVVPEEPVEYDITIKVHYYRADGDYSNWEVHMWNGVDSLSSTRKFTEEDENGWKVATYYADACDTWVGFIIKKPDWTKDPDGDRKIDLTNVTGGTVHVYAVSGSALEDFDTNKDEATLGNKIIAATYDKLIDRLTVTTSMPLDVAPETVFGLKGPDGKMTITRIIQIGDCDYILEYEGKIDPQAAYTAYFNDLGCPVQIPEGYSTEAFEAEYTYTGSDLGATWSAGSTTFRVWAPTASAVSVNLYTTGSDAESGAAALGSYAMTQDVNGTWIVTVSGDLNGVYYTYSVTRRGETVEACDPYARTTGVNGDRAMVIDLDSTDPAGWENDTYVTVDNYTDAVIWELHVRDFSIDESSGMTNKGKYLAFTELGTTVPGTDISTGIDYMKELGINYVHLLPVYDINSVDETTGGYNWGYDPKNYNVPEGSYSTNPYDGAVRVNEFKQMVQSLHNAGIGVVMDVVYNHVADAGKFCFNQIVPEYFSRVMDDGSYLSNSGCGNDTASERSMVSKYIVDSVLYWAEEYHIDGFRWDLVGLIDVDTINAVMAAVHEVNPNIIFYGEGWEMCSWTSKEGYKDKMTIQPNDHLVNTKAGVFAFFNDTIRNVIHGGVFVATDKGFVSGNVSESTYNTVVDSYMGNSTWGSNGGSVDTPLQTVNYASCHDNYTLFDNLTLDAMDMTGKTAAEVAEQAAAMNKLAAAYYITAQGVPFIHAGEEMLRSKPDAQQESGFNHNSYAAGDVINSIKWNTLADELVDNTHDYYQGLIAFRAAHDAMRMTTEAEILSAMSAVDAGSNDVIVLLNKGGNGEQAEILSIFNADAAEQTVTLPEGKWEVYVNGELAGTTVLETVAGTVTVSGTSAMILVKAAEEEPEVTEPTEPEESEPTEPSEPETTEPSETTAPETTAPEATTKPGTGDNAQTADAFNMVWFAVLAVSAVATVALMAARKKLF